MSFTHKCIKCENSYTDTDPDAYYCPDCQATNKAIAAEIDKRLHSKSRREVVSPLKAYDNARKVRGFVHARDLF